MQLYNPNKVLICPVGYGLAGLEYEGATWSGGNDTHAGPEIPRWLCRKFNTVPPIDYGDKVQRNMVNPSKTLVCPDGYVFGALEYEGATWSSNNDGHAGPEIPSWECRRNKPSP